MLVGSEDKASAELETSQLKQAAAWGLPIVDKTSLQLFASNLPLSIVCSPASADATSDPLSSLSDQQTSSSGSSLFIVDDVVEGISSATETALSGRLKSIPSIVIAAAFTRDMVGLDPNTPIPVSGIGAELCINSNSKGRKKF